MHQSKLPVSTDPRAACLAGFLFLIVSFFSFYQNALMVTSGQFFAEHQIASEQLVLDGILHARHNPGDRGQIMGKYLRSDSSTDYLRVRDYYSSDNADGEFVAYRSQFGLQFHAFRLLAKLNNRVEFLHAIAALLMAMVVAALFVGLSREASISFAALFCLPLVVSPWVVAFARNLYWVEFTWFLPAVATLFLGRRAQISTTGFVTMLAALFACLLIKFLCGYEYATTVVLASFVFIAWHVLKCGGGIRRLIMQLAICGVGAVMAFSVAVVLHAAVIAPSLSEGFEQVSSTAKKRLTSRLAGVNFVEQLCAEEKFGRPVAACLEEYSTSLSANPVTVLARYFIMPRFVPWIDAFSMDEVDKTALKDASAGRDPAEILKVVRSMPATGVAFLASQGISAVAFLAFNILVVYRIRRKLGILMVVTGLAFLASISWHVFAKGHSFIHTHMNYVLWYLLYIPCGAASLAAWSDRNQLDTGGKPGEASSVTADSSRADP